MMKSLLVLLLTLPLVALAADPPQEKNVARNTERLLFEQVAPLPGALAVSGNGRVAAHIRADGDIVIWRTSDARTLETIAADGKKPSAVALNADGDLLAIGYFDSRLIVWSRPEKRAWREFYGHSGGISALTFSPSGQWLASGGEDGTTQLWELATGQRQHIFDARISEDIGIPVSIGFSGDECALVVNEWYSRHYDVGRGITVWNIEAEDDILFWDIAPPNSDDSTMRAGQALGGQGWLSVFTGEDGLMTARLDRLNPHEPPSQLPSGQYADTVAADPLGRWVAAVEGDKKGNKITFFGMGNNPQSHVVALPAKSIAVVPQTDGHFVFALMVADTRQNGNGRFIFGRDAETVTGARLYRLPVPAPLLRLPPLNIKENATCRIPGRSPDFRLPEQSLELTVVARLAPGSTLRLKNGWGDAGNFLTKEHFSYVSKYEKERMEVTYDSDTGEVYRLAVGYGQTGRIAAGPIEHYGADGQRLQDIEARGNVQSFTARNGRLAVLYQDGDVQVWQIKPYGASKTYKLLDLADDLVWLSALSTDGRYLRVSFAGVDGPDMYSIFRLGSGELPGNGDLLTPFPGQANRGVVADIRPHRLAVWDYDKGEIIARLPRQRSRDKEGNYVPLRAAISDDGRLVASASYDGLVRVWDIDARRMVGEGRVGSEVTAMAFDLTGRRLAAGREDSEIVIFEIPAAQ